MTTSDSNTIDSKLPPNMTTMTMMFQPPTITSTTPTTPAEYNTEGWRSPVLTPINLYYPLGPCRTKFETSRLAEILHELQDVFRILSLETVFQESPIAATCQTLDQVEFNITVLQSRRNPSESILEIQRKSGDTMSFHCTAHQILAAVSGQTPTSRVSTSSSAWNVRMAQRLDSLLPPKVDDATTSGVVSALELAWGMLSTDRLDAQRLGLESLVHMTDPTKSGWSTAQTASLLLLTPENNLQANLSMTLVRFVSSLDAATLDGEPFGPEKFAHLSLIALSQVFGIAAKQEATQRIQQFLQWIKPIDLVHSILRLLRDGPHHPHLTYVAVQCVTALCPAVPQLRLQIKSRDVQELQHFGDLHHCALANASQQLLVALQV